MMVDAGGHKVVRVAAIAVALVAVGAGSYFRGQSTRMSDGARAAERRAAVSAAVRNEVAQTKQDDAVAWQAKVDDQADADDDYCQNELDQQRESGQRDANQKAARARKRAYEKGTRYGFALGYGAW